MEHIRDEIRIEAPVDHVWAFYCDTSRWPDWMPRATFSDFSGPYPKAGTTYVSTMKMMGFEMKQTSTVLEVEPLKLIHEQTDGWSMDSLYRFEPEGDTTRLIVEAAYEMPGHSERNRSTSCMSRHLPHLFSLAGPAGRWATVSPRPCRRATRRLAAPTGRWPQPAG